MFYQITDQIKTIAFQEYDGSKLTIGILSEEELQEVAKAFHFHPQTLQEMNHIHTNRMDIYEDYDFGTILLNDMKGKKEGQHLETAFYIRRNLLLLCCHDTERITNALNEVLNRLPLKTLTLEKLIYTLLERALSNDFSYLQKINEQIEMLEEEIMNDRSVNFHQEIAPLRKILLLFESHYNHLIEIGSDLQENENDVFEESNLRFFHMLTDRISRLYNQTRMLRDYMTQVREAYQAQTDNRLNQIMKLFTVVTTIFLPLTLIVGWYGMNFTNMPELTWQYGYLSVIVISVVVVAFCIYYFKKKNLF